MKKPVKIILYVLAIISVIDVIFAILQQRNLYVISRDILCLIFFVSTILTNNNKDNKLTLTIFSWAIVVIVILLYILEKIFM